MSPDETTMPPPVKGGANSRFCRRVEAEIEARGWSARELSRRAGTAHNMLTFLRAGRWISLEYAARVADALGVPLGDLVAEDAAPAGEIAPGIPAEAAS